MELKLPLSVAGSFVLGYVTASYFAGDDNNTAPEPIEVVATERQDSVDTRLTASTKDAAARPLFDEQALQLDQARAELEQARLEIDELKRGSLEMAEKVNHQSRRAEELKQELQVKKQEYARVLHQLGQEAESKITNEQMQSLVDEPFSAFLTGFRGEARDQVYDFFQQPEDLDWGYQMQMKIGDFIQTHPLQASVELVGITCKINQCEFRVIEKEPEQNAYQTIFNDLQKQSWWHGASTHSSSGNITGQPGINIFTFVQFNA